MTFDEIKNIGIKNLVFNASTMSLKIPRELFLAKWSVESALLIAESENTNGDLISSLRKAQKDLKDLKTPDWGNLLELC